MAQAVSTSITRRSVAAGLALAAAPVAVLAAANNAYAQAKQPTTEKSLYERLGGAFAIAAVVDHFSDAVVKNPIVGQKSKNPQLREWHTKNLSRLPGLKFMRTLWVCNVSGGPFQYTATKPGATPLGLEEAHRDLRISPAEMVGGSHPILGSSVTQRTNRQRNEETKVYIKYRLALGFHRLDDRFHETCIMEPMG